MKYKSNVQAQIQYINELKDKLVKRFQLTSASRFIYKGLEEFGIPNDYIEKLLYQDGKCVITKDGTQLLALKVSGVGGS